MKIECSNGKYYVRWTVHAETLRCAKDWCHEVFGGGWGFDMKSEPNGLGIVNSVFMFERLYHAQWFITKWA